MVDVFKSYPRTTRDAFKPAHDTGVEGPFSKPPVDWQDKVVLYGCVFTVVVCIAFALLGWIV
jgi:hypothetical protein